MTNPTNVHVIPSEWEWDSLAVEYADTYGIPYEIVEAAAANPTSSEYDPHSGEVGWEIRRHRRGDIVAVVGYRDPANPIILHCAVIFPGEGRGLPNQRQTPGSGQGSTEPQTVRGLRKRIIEKGFRIQAGKRHDKVTDQNGNYVFSLVNTPSEYRSVSNQWHAFLRAVEEWNRRQRVARGNLLVAEDTDDA